MVGAVGGQEKRERQELQEKEQKDTKAKRSVTNTAYTSPEPRTNPGFLSLKIFYCLANSCEIYLQSMCVIPRSEQLSAVARDG